MKPKKVVKVALATGDIVTVKDYGDGLLVGGGLGGFLTDAELNQAAVNTDYAVDKVRTALKAQSASAQGKNNQKEKRKRTSAHGLTPEDLSELVGGHWGQSRKDLLGKIEKEKRVKLTKAQLSLLITKARRLEDKEKTAVIR